MRSLTATLVRGIGGVSMFLFRDIPYLAFRNQLQPATINLYAPAASGNARSSRNHNRRSERCCDMLTAYSSVVRRQGKSKKQKHALRPRQSYSLHHNNMIDIETKI